MSRTFYDVFIEVCQKDGNLKFEVNNSELPDIYINKDYLKVFDVIPDEKKEYEARELKNVFIEYYINRDKFKSWKENAHFLENPKRVISKRLKILNDFQEFMNCEILDFYINTGEVYKETPKQLILKFISEIIKEFEQLQDKSNSNGKKKKAIKDFHILQIERYYKNIEYEYSQKESVKDYFISLAKKYNITYGSNIDYIISEI